MTSEPAPENAYWSAHAALLLHSYQHWTGRALLIAATAVMTLIGLAVLDWLMAQPWFYTNLGVTQASSYIALVLFLLVFWCSHSLCSL